MRIYKYPFEVEREQIIFVPGLIKVLSIVVQNNGLVLYAIIKPEENHLILQVEVMIKGTGWDFDDIATDWEFRGTHLLDIYVWHVWTRCV